MSYLKTTAEASERAQLNTTIKKDVLENFKAFAREINVPMNTLIECFMQQCIDGCFKLEVHRKKDDAKKKVEIEFID